ncbi:unnamed protein product [Triticum turgidum subsp. durum]|uniref:Serine carboxypeptidase-like 19 n=1 Tax=Triticum turgidum subsp. durum TaxID=4567 RepID=A0A9R1RGM3_TRITD|nr:unnamed protein product [Triticum turgidum subsp. durum]
MEAQLLSRLLFLLLGFIIVSGEAAPTLVTSLPGFDGALPFHLETGYVTVDEEHGSELFYYFIESEGDPRRDPVLLWLTGGDRCSVLSALLFEMGPLRFVIEPYDGAAGTVPRLHYHPYSWTKAASVLFVDSPVGAGFSFSRHPRGYDVGEVSSSLQLKTFLTKWFTEHPDFLSNHFYVGGDSYAGKYVPIVAQKISEDIEAGLKPTINLKLLEEIYDSQILYKKCNYLSPTPNDKTTHGRILQQETGALKHPPPRPQVDCHGYITYLAYVWANNNITRENLGIKEGSMGEWVRCHEKDLPFTHDIESSIKYHRNITSKGYRALVYSGDHDAVVPFLGTQSWVRSLNFPIMDEWRAWHLDGQSAGFTIAYTNNMTFATVKGGGHTAPSYQPERCLAMLRRWISNEPL